MLETTTKTETGKELKLWLEGKEMKATLEGLLEGNEVYRKEYQGFDVIDCGTAIIKGQKVTAVIKVNDDIKDFLNKAEKKIEKQEEAERNSELMIEIIETSRSSAWTIQDLVLDPQEKLLSEEQEEQLELLRSLLGEVALFAGAGKHIKANKLPVKLGETYTLTEIMEMLKDTEEYKAKVESEKKQREDEERAFEVAKETGEDVKLRTYSVECNDPNEECSMDIITVYATPEGKKRSTRTHTY